MWDGFAGLIAGDDELAGVVGEPRVRFGYATGLWRRGLLRVIPSLDTAADSLKEFLVTEAGGFDRLVLVGHSQGGLVIQRCLVRMLAEGRGRELTRVCRVVLLATPNTGSQLLLGLRRGLVWGNAQERALRPFDELVADTRRIVVRDLVHAREVTERSCPVPFSVYAGESDAVVTPASARDVFPEAAALPGDHFEIARPDSREHRTYTTVKRLVLQAAAAGDRDPPGGATSDARVRVLRAGVVPEPPEWAVERGQTEQVVAAVLAAGSSQTVGITTAVYGAGGFGKSTVAQLVCADARVRERFGDRIYWVTVGWGRRSREQIAAKVAEATVLITGERDQLPDPLAAGSYLGSLLQDADLPVLLVLDDVWDGAQLSPFLLGAPTCVRLVTTRIRGVLPRGAAAVLVDRLENAQALALLADGLPGLPTDLAKQIVAACGRWALLLRLANRWIVDQAATEDDPAKHARVLLDRLQAGPSVVDRPEAMIEVEDPQARNDLIEASVRASLALLTAPTRKRFLDLGAFAPDEPIPIRVLAKLWGVATGMDEAAVRQACRDLERLALIGIDPSDSGAVLVHDVLHSYARAALGSDGIQRASRALVRAIEATLPPTEGSGRAGQRLRAAWWQLDPMLGGYLVDHAIELLCAAGDLQQAEALAGDLRWIGARLLQHGPTAPIRDLVRVGGLDADARAVDLTRIAHLLTPTEPAYAVIDTMYSYLQPLPVWSRQVATLYAQPAQRARLINAWPPPDLPDEAQRNTLPDGLGLGRVRTLVFSRDGSQLAAGGSTFGPLVTLRFWHLTTGALTHSLYAGQTGSDPIRLATVDEAGVMHELDLGATVSDLMTAAEGDWPPAIDNLGLFAQLEIWMSAPSAVLAGLYEHALNESSDKVTAMAIAPSGAWLAAGESSGKVRVWDVAAARHSQTLTGHDGEVNTIAIAPDGAWLVTGGSDHTTRIWDVVTGGLVRILAGHGGAVSVVAISPDGTTIASSASNGTVRVWDVATGALVRTLDIEGLVTALAISPDGTRLAIGGGVLMNGRVQVWELPTDVPRPTMDSAGGGAAIELYRRGVVAPRDGRREIRVWDLSTGVPGQPPAGRLAVAISPRGILAASDRDGAVKVWDLATNHLTGNLIGHTSFVRAIAIGSDGSIASADDHGAVQLWHAKTGKLTRTLTGNLDQQYAVAFTPSGTCVAAYRRADTVRVWNVNTGGLLHTLTGHGKVDQVAFASNGARLATGGNHTVRIWNTATGTLVRTLTVAADTVSAVAFTPDATRIAVAEDGAQGLLRVWDVATGVLELEHTLIDRGWGYRMVFAQDGARLATASGGQRDATIRIWDLSRGVCEAALRVDEQLVLGAAWGPLLVITGDRGLHGYQFKLPGTQQPRRDQLRSW